MACPPLLATLGALVASGLVLSGCITTIDLRVENISARAYSTVRVAGQSFGDLAPGETSPYRPVRLRARYAALEFWVDGHKVTGQTLNSRASPVTYRIAVTDPTRSRLRIDIVRD